MLLKTRFCIMFDVQRHACVRLMSMRLTRKQLGMRRRQSCAARVASNGLRRLMQTMQPLLKHHA